MASLPQFLSQLRAILGGQSKARRLFSLLTILGCAGALLYAGFRRDGGPYAPLFPNMQVDDAAAVAEHMKTTGIPYKLADDGKTILVPEAKIPELRMQLAQANLPTGGGVGFEWFDKPPIGMTDRVQQINYVRALQGELGRSISTLQGVTRARVILAVPDRTVFLRTEENKPSASVVLELAHGAALSSRNVEGILNLVSRAVEGLEPDRIALVDARTGESLNRTYENPNQLGAEQNLSFQRQYERSLESDIETMLERWVGKGRVVARVRSDFDFSQTTTNATKYDDDSKAIESETQRAENVALAGGANPGGVVGAASQIPGADKSFLTASQPTASNNGSLTTEKRYKVSETQVQTTQPSGRLNGLTVAVMVDYQDKETTDPDTKEKKVAAAPRTPEELKTFENLVKRAIGCTDEKADTFQISVECVQFKGPEETVEDKQFESLQQQEWIRELVTWGVYALLGVLALLFVARPVLQALTLAAAPAARMRPVFAGGPDDEGAPQLEGAAGEGRKRFPINDAKQAQRLLERAETASTNQKLEDLMKSDPARAAALIRKWLEENG
ncbi:MAG: flagellar basal-body MS-ring/collar protein FliF [Candidatus Sumerlaeota bacterium]|nr:flagellar basal-body MS-ring/collar protein FliF [Candidatus Sumerlaeota bacterium]